jgi:outer membrane protein assembly factor BamB
MPGNGKVFISHVHEDNARAQPLLAALDAWGVDYWFDTQQLDAGNSISERVQRALAERDVFLLVATGATNRSLWTGLETQAFRGLAEQDRQAGRAGRREIVYLVLDRAFQRPQVRPDERLVDATGDPRLWLKQLRAALGRKPPARALSRRAVLGSGVVAGAAVVASAVTGGLLLSSRGGGRPSPVIPTTHAPTPTPLQGSDRVQWFFAMESTPQGVAVDGATVYSGGIGGLYALTGAAGDVSWYHKRYSPATPRIANGVLYFADYNGYLFAVKAADGSEIWSTKIGFGTQTTPALMPGTVYVNSSDGFLYAMNPANGAVHWKTQVDGSTVLGSSSPAVGAGLVYVGSNDSNIYALDAATGAVRWKRLTGGKVISSPAAAGSLVYIGSADQNIYALDAATGAVRWQVKTGGEVNSSPLVANGVVYIGSEDYTLYALRAATGATLWKASTQDPDKFDGDPIDTLPAIAGGVVYVTASQSLYAFNLADGSRAWRFTVSDSSFGSPSSPVVANGLVYFGSDSDTHAVYAVKA